MRILVTGGAGFIGSHLCQKLLEEGHEVLCIDSFISGSFKNIEVLMKNAAFRFLEHDICVPLKEDIGKIDQIYHLACPGSPVDYTEIPLQVLWTSAVGTKMMLELAFRHNAAFLLASSSDVYGQALEGSLQENYYGNVDPVGEISCSGEGKRFAESLAMTYYRDYRFPLKIVRIFETYGPRMRKRDGRIISEFMMAAFAQEPLRIRGDGLQLGYFCYVDDMIGGLMQMMDRKDFIGPVNLGNTVPERILEVAKKIIDLTHSSSMISPVPNSAMTEQYHQPDLTLAQEKLNFKPTMKFDEGITKTLRFFEGSS